MRERGRNRFDVGGEGRIEWSVIDRMIPDDVNDRSVCPACVVKIGQAVREAGAEMQKCRCGFICHPPVPICRAGDDVLLETEDGSHAGDPVEGRDKMHLGSSRICDTEFDSRINERAK